MATGFRAAPRTASLCALNHAWSTANLTWHVNVSTAPRPHPLGRDACVGIATSAVSRRGIVRATVAQISFPSNQRGPFPFPFGEPGPASSSAGRRKSATRSLRTSRGATGGNPSANPGTFSA